LTARVVVIVPAWNEAPRIARVVRGMPALVDSIVVVDDASTDGTADAARGAGDGRVEVATHAHNRGVGGAVVTGYHRALAKPGDPRDAFVVMAGDGQMDPRDLPGLLEPIARGEADYVKGDRFRMPDTVRIMPPARRLGGLVLSWATTHAIGVPISDSQCGYTAIARDACARLDLDALWPRYGYPNDLLSQLARRRLRIAEVPVRAVYADEVSRLKLRHVPMIAALIARAAVARVRTALRRDVRTRPDL
jgi:glycosyltransferase involved in cell wall biosynthesis